MSRWAVARSRAKTTLAVQARALFAMIDPADPSRTPSETPADVDFDAESEAPSDDASLRHFSWKLGKTLDRRVDQYLVDRVGYLSRNEVQRLIDDGFVTVNGKKTKPSYKPKLDDVVAMTAPPPRASTIAPEPIPLSIVYEDDHMLAINKQTNIIVHPARGVWSGTLVNALVHYGNVHGHTWSTINGAWRPGILHRLDRNTTGVMLVAKSDEAHWRLARQFEQRTIQKTYMALVHGIPELLADVIDAPIGRDKFIREKMAVRKIESGAKEAVTKYEVLERIETKGSGFTLLGAASGTGRTVRSVGVDNLPDARSLNPDHSFSLVRFSPKTGRTHQIRVHATHIGHPIVGDVVYGGKTVEAVDGSLKFERQALHAYQITFVHPITLKTMTLEAPLPQDITDVVKLLKQL
jgi:23S rRNA pseudouridine1911/1915/1917 synthase